MNVPFQPLRTLVIGAILVFGVLGAFAGITVRAQQSSAAAQSQVSPFRLVSATSGTKETTKNEQYVIEDPRNIFHLPADNKVIVVLNWDGPTGLHHFQASWVDPSGKVVFIGDVDIQSPSSRFSCSWTLNITDPDSTRAGLWALESKIDGLSAGAYTFQIVASPNSANAHEPVPTAADIYQHVLAASVFIDSLGADGSVFRQGSGFFIGKGIVATAFQVIDGATSLRIDFPNGQNAITDRVLAWNRWQDWAILKVDDLSMQVLERAPADSWKVGDHAYLLDANQGGRTIQNVAITGIQQSPDAGERVNTSWWGGKRTMGSPLLDESGRVIGVLGGSLIPGIESVKTISLGNYAITGQPFVDSFVPLVVPISLLPPAASLTQSTTLAEIAAKGDFLQPLARDPQLANARLCKAYNRVGNVALTPVGQTTQFSRSRDSLQLVITWAPQTREKTSMQVRIFDLNNHAVEESKPDKIDLEPQRTAFTGVRMTIASLTPGVYRVDVLLGDAPEWRAFFKVTE
ncbi:MAG TPA: serine protease [Candidatus Acidoferrales bacterium]|nr:serine protease [Candidatus Acidoferrales bacterium]